MDFRLTPLAEEGVHPLELVEVGAAGLAEYSTISIAFVVDRILDIAAADAGRGWQLTERAIAAPYVKDYDQLDGEAPLRWAGHFDLSQWSIVLARRDGVAVGGAAVAHRTTGMSLLEGRDDLAALWDIRVAPGLRGHRIGAALFAAAERWARSRGCRQLRVETQDTNAAACRFYARQGCRLEEVHRDAYPSLPGEVHLLWTKTLADDPEP